LLSLPDPKRCDEENVFPFLFAGLFTRKPLSIDFGDPVEALTIGFHGIDQVFS
jgi:hypothetical protein